MPALADIAGILCDCPLSCKLLTVQACLPTVRFWPGTEISAADLLAEKLPFNSVEREEFRCNSQRQVVADSTSTRGCPKAAARVISTRSRNPWLDFSLFRNFQRVIHLDAEVSDRTFQFGMAKQ